MRSLLRVALSITATLALAACSGGGGAATTGPAATVCNDSTGTTVVAATVQNRTWSQPVSAKVGDVITWTNSDSVPHKVALDDGSCTMSANIGPSGGTHSLVFTKAGTYPFHCAIHPSMTGTITIS
ncbi:MAG TPA: plastocyanin/azurin family copper-binding protein [Candidatus Dormibacteraeota bacterium]|nr:plastocyanin/azurin family copper-binding protein [Candidatus Dormibacteraeota bacterium]